MPLPTAPFDPAMSIFAGLTVAQIKLLPNVTGVTATAATDVIAKAGHTFVDGQLINYVSGTGFTGLVAGTNYFVRDVVAGVSFKLAATKGGAAIDITADGTVGVFVPVLVVEVPELDDNPDSQTVALKRPDAKGVMRTVREVETEVTEKWTFPLEEPKRLPSIFDGALRGRKEVLATLWVPDPDQAAGTVALKSESDFPATLTRDGSMKHGGGQFSKASLVLKSRKNGDVTWTADAAA